MGPIDSKPSPQRRRGVVASRAKLARALGDAGLKTQAALAERIAEREDLDNVPRDIVSRAFRELPVDPLTLERIALALGVEAHTLYKTADEAVVIDAQRPAATRRVGLRPALIVAAAAVAIALLLTFTARRGGEELVDSDTAQPTVSLDLGTATLVVLPLSGDADDVIGAALRDRLAGTFSVAAETASVLTQTLDRAEVADKFRADAILDGDMVTVGRFIGLRFYLLTAGVRRQIWGESLPSASLPHAINAIAERADLALRRATGLPSGKEDPAPHFPLAPVQDDYLAGMMYLDRPSSELNVKRAQTRFEAALRQDANFARAHAGLCQALLEEYWMSDEDRVLKDAGRACGQALQLAPDDPLVAAAHAHFLSRTGRNDDALSLYERIVADYPDDASAWSGFAASLLEQYRATGDTTFLARAMDAASTAADVDPAIWKPLFALGTMEWFAGNVDGAIKASEAALSRDRNEYVLANLGTFYLCDGAFEQALDAYAEAQDIAPQSYVGDEFMGLANYFLGNFEESLRLRQQAIESIATGEPEIHEMWGNLADSFRQLGRTDEAIDAYLKAAEIAERDYLRGTRPAGDRAARAYYYTVLAALDSSLVPPTIAAQISAELDDIGATIVSSSAHRRMAQIWLLRGEVEKARASLASATATCPGFSKLPDLAELATR